MYSTLALPTNLETKWNYLMVYYLQFANVLQKYQTHINTSITINDSIFNYGPFLTLCALIFALSYHCYNLVAHLIDRAPDKVTTHTRRDNCYHISTRIGLVLFKQNHSFQLSSFKHRAIIGKSFCRRTLRMI